MASPRLGLGFRVVVPNILFIALDVDNGVVEVIYAADKLDDSDSWYK